MVVCVCEPRRFSVPICVVAFRAMAVSASLQKAMEAIVAGLTERVLNVASKRKAEDSVACHEAKAARVEKRLEECEAEKLELAGRVAALEAEVALMRSREAYLESRVTQVKAREELQSLRRQRYLEGVEEIVESDNEEAPQASE